MRNGALSPAIAELLHRVDGLTPPVPPTPPLLAPTPRHQPEPRRWPRLAAATVLAAASLTAVVSQPWSSHPVAALFAPVQVSSELPALLPLDPSGEFRLVAGELVPATPEHRGRMVITGRLDGDRVVGWTSAWASPRGMRQWFDGSDFERVDQRGRTVELLELDGAVLAEYDSGGCGRITISTAAGDRASALEAADRVSCEGGGSVAARPVAPAQLLYKGPRNSAPDDGLVLTYETSPGSIITYHLRRVGLPPQLWGVEFEGGGVRSDFGGKYAVIRDGEPTVVTWAVPPDVTVSVAAGPDIDRATLERFVASVQPVPDETFDEACRQVLGDGCRG